MNDEPHLRLIPPGHGEPDGPGPQPRCPICAGIVGYHPASLRVGWAGWCQTHGSVSPVYGQRDEILARADNEPVPGAARRPVWGPRGHGPHVSLDPAPTRHGNPLASVLYEELRLLTLDELRERVASAGLDTEGFARQQIIATLIEYEIRNGGGEK